MHIQRRRGWEIAERDATAEKHFLSRRQFLQSSALALGAAAIRCSPPAVLQTIPAPRPPYPFQRNPAFALDRRLSDPAIAATFNNFYEFSAIKDEVWKLTEKFRTNPWTVDVGG